MSVTPLKWSDDFFPEGLLLFLFATCLAHAPPPISIIEIPFIAVSEAQCCNWVEVQAFFVFKRK